MSGLHPNLLCGGARSRPDPPYPITSPPTQHKLPRLPPPLPSTISTSGAWVGSWFTPRLAFLSETLGPSLHPVITAPCGVWEEGPRKQVWAQTCLRPFPLVGSRKSPDPFSNPAISCVCRQALILLYFMGIGKDWGKVNVDILGQLEANGMTSRWPSWRGEGKGSEKGANPGRSLPSEDN